MLLPGSWSTTPETTIPEVDPLSNQITDHKIDYDQIRPDAERIRNRLVRDIGSALEIGGVRLASPLESRVKEWESVRVKVQKGVGGIKRVSELQDLVGLRIVVPFTRDLDSVRRALLAACHVIRQYDTADHLRHDRFGYLAAHYIVAPRDALGSAAQSQPIVAEIQVRTSTQHLWAVASHLLQYKSEVAPPPELKRAVNRVAALLEVVDLEFERLLQARQEYRKEAQIADDDAALNVDLLAVALPRLWPAEHQGAQEVLDGLLHALDRKGIRTLGELRSLIAEQRSAVFRDSLAQAKEILYVVEHGTKAGDTYTVVTANGSSTHSGISPELIERARKGIFYSLSGLTFTALQFAFGERIPPT